MSGVDLGPYIICNESMTSKEGSCRIISHDWLDCAVGYIVFFRYFCEYNFL